MSLLNANMQVAATAAANVSMTLPPGQSARVNNIFLNNVAAIAEDVGVFINRKKIMQFKVPESWQLVNESRGTAFHSILRTLVELGLFAGIPLTEGETLEIKSTGTAREIIGVYDLYDKDGPQATEMNGSKADSYQLFQVISNGTAVAAAGETELNVSDLDSLFPAFPAGAVVPANTEMRLKALFGSPVTIGDASDPGIYTTYLKFLRNREDIFDKDLTGIRFLGDSTYDLATAAYKHYGGVLKCGDPHIVPGLLVFGEPIIFGPGDELNVFAVCAKGAGVGPLAIGDIKLGMLFDVAKRS